MVLSDKIAVVTGANRGLGRAISQLFVARGATVYGLARNEQKLSETADALGERFIPIVCDVVDPEAVKQAFEQVREEAGRCDVLVNNAGFGGYIPFMDQEEEVIDDMIDVNLRGVIHCTRAAIPMMKAQNAESGFGGHIVMIASVAGLIGSANFAVYNLTKFGIRGFSEALMKELRDDGIKITCVYPGSIRTEFADVAGSSGAAHPMEPEDVAETVRHIVESPTNYLVSEVAMRPLRPKG